MKKVIIFVLGVLSIHLAYSQTQVKVMSFNIHVAVDATVEELGEFIKGEQPDLVAIQEIDHFSDRSKHPTDPRKNNNNEDMISNISYISKMQGMLFPTLTVHGGEFGNAILSRFGMEQTFKVPLAYVDKTEKRIAAISDIKLPNGKIVRFICTHLDMANHDNGMNQIKELKELAKESPYPVILAGDLNRRVGTNHIDELETEFDRLVSNEFDHILTYPKGAFKTTSTKVYTGNKLSDHLPIMVTLEIED